MAPTEWGSVLVNQMSETRALYHEPTAGKVTSLIIGFLIACILSSLISMLFDRQHGIITNVREAQKALVVKDWRRLPWIIWREMSMNHSDDVY